MDEPNVTTAPEDQAANVTIQDGDDTQQLEVGTGDSFDNNGDNNQQQQDNQQDQQQQQPQAQTNKDQLANEVGKHQETLKAIEKDLRAKGVDFKEAIKEYEQSGNISDRTIANLVSAGYPKEVIESFLESRKVLEERFTNAVYEAAGGAEEYMQLTSWAQSNLPESTIKAFNKAVDSNDLDMISLMISGIQSKMVAARGTRNPSIIGSSQSQGESRGFASKADMIKAMSDPRYNRDAAYTRSVEQKMYYTNF